MPSTHIVTRPFGGPGGRVYKVGEPVDASKWKHTLQLVEQRRLRPLLPGEQITLPLKKEKGDGK